MDPVDETAATGRCAAALGEVGAAGPGARRAAAALVERYREPHRRYHTLAHVDAVLDGVDALVAAGEAVRDLAAVRVAAWYHDAVVTLEGTGDEARSAALAVDDLRVLGAAPDRAEHVAALVRATARHEAASADAAVLVDADLAVLAAEPVAYAAYAAAVREEYAAVDDAAFRVGRAAVLRRLLDRERLFLTATMAARGEARARRNLAVELADLERGRDRDGDGGPPPGSFAAAVHAVVAATVPGEVVTYGDVAAEAGRPGAARAVGTALRRSRGLPWWRVVSASGRLVPGKEAEHGARLRAEGVPVRDGRVRRG